MAVKNPTGFFGPLIVRCTSCPISRGLLPSDNGSTADSVRRWEQSEPDGGGQAHAKERTTERGSRPLWVYKGPCPLLALSPISVHTEMGPSGAPLPLRSGKNPRRASTATQWEVWPSETRPRWAAGSMPPSGAYLEKFQLTLALVVKIPLPQGRPLQHPRLNHLQPPGKLRAGVLKHAVPEGN